MIATAAALEVCDQARGFCLLGCSQSALDTIAAIRANIRYFAPTLARSPCPIGEMHAPRIMRCADGSKGLFSRAGLRRSGGGHHSLDATADDQ